MATSFGALCTDFYVNQKLAVKMDLPGDRETILHLFDRVRNDHPAMKRFRRYSDELSLESSRRDGAYQWLALRANSVRCGHVNPDSLDAAYDLHRLILKLVPYNLTISPLDVDYQELLFGFDLEARDNQHEIVFDALFADSPLGALLECGPDARCIDAQPIFGVSLNDGCDLQAYFEVKTSTSTRQVRSGKFRTEPISILLTIRKLGPVDSPDAMLENFDMMAQTAERLANDRVVPDLLTPISRAITSSA
ncbi:hypothetical protein HED60_01775 [Planctomycetales bacterium ZRK34]|nr:hypothetical protein HED60_01775 [Planctomycetales bacterium ZRK34]